MSKVTVEDIIREMYEIAREELVQRYKEGATIAQLSRDCGLARETVYRRLKAAGAYVGPGRPGAQRKTHCKRNHDLAVHGIPATGGGRQCAECKRMRQRTAWKNSTKQ